LAQPHQIGVGVLVDPLSAHDELITEVADVGDRTAEAGQSKLEEDPQDLQRRTGVGPISDDGG